MFFLLLAFVYFVNKQQFAGRMHAINCAFMIVILIRSNAS